MVTSTGSVPSLLIRSATISSPAAVAPTSIVSNSPRMTAGCPNLRIPSSQFWLVSRVRDPGSQGAVAGGFRWSWRELPLKSRAAPRGDRGRPGWIAPRIPVETLARARDIVRQRVRARLAASIQWRLSHRENQQMWIVELAFRRRHTFIVDALFIFLFGPMSVLRNPPDIFIHIDIPVLSNV